jgi:hypothetical protein
MSRFWSAAYSAALVFLKAKTKAAEYAALQIVFTYSSQNLPVSFTISLPKLSFVIARGTAFLDESWHGRRKMDHRIAGRHAGV